MRGSRRGLGWTGLLLAFAALAPAVAWGQEPSAGGVWFPASDREPQAASFRGFNAERSLHPFVFRGQDATGYALPDTFIPTPLGGTRPEEGFFFYGTGGMYKQTVPLGDQVVAIRGFRDTDGSITGAQGAFYGSGDVALRTQQITGPQSQQPSFKIGVGHRFYDGSTLELSWLHLATQRYTAVATLLPGNMNLQPDLSDTFLYSGVTNFPGDFSGPPNDINGQGAFGVWNGADLMTIDFTQRNEIYELVYKLAPVIDTLDWRTYGLLGPRFVWFWERFRWRTFDADDQNAFNEAYNAFYTNIISNRMYGLKIGVGNDWYIGNGFSCNTECFVTPMINIVKKRAKYERGDIGYGPERKRADTDYTLVPEFGGSLSLNWFPYEGIQVKASYNAQLYLNTITSEEPIDFDYNALTPDYDHQLVRFLHGFEVGICFRF